MVRLNRRKLTRLKEWLDPSRDRHETFTTPLSVADCEEILRAHINPSGIGRLTHRRAVKRKPRYNGSVKDGKFSIRKPIPKLKRTESVLTGSLYQAPPGTRIEAQFRVQIASTVKSAEMTPHLSSQPTSLPLLLLAAFADMALAEFDRYLLWSRQNEWDHYAWFLENYLSATLLTPGSPDNG